MSSRDWDKRLMAHRARLWAIQLEARETAIASIQKEMSTLSAYLDEMPQSKVAKTKELIEKFKKLLAKHVN